VTTGPPDRQEREDRVPDRNDEPRGRDLSLDEIADIDVLTSVNARWLKFGVVPETEVSFDGYPAERSSSRTERENLPEEVEPGVPYRDVRVTWRARSRIVHPADPVDDDTED
jgi:hypothetical protein